MDRGLYALGLIAFGVACAKPAPPPPPTPVLGPKVRPYVRVATAKVILAHVEVIDGTGAPPMPDRNVYIADGKITAIAPAADEPATAGTTILDLRGYSVIPGLVGMHEHLFYLARPDRDTGGTFDGPSMFVQMTYSAPRLYLANGVTTLRTAGSIQPYTDLALKRAIDAGIVPGPHLDVTGPYLDGPNDHSLQMPELAGAAAARETVAFWADRGVTSFKAYAHITRAELKAAIDEAHARGLKVTGHLCSVTYEEAAALGIDNLEHGFFVNTARDPDKKPDTCSKSGGDDTLALTTPGSPEAMRLLETLVRHHVAITSTLPGLASSVDDRPLRQAVLDAMSPALRDAVAAARERPRPARNAELLRQDMALERSFVAAGGLLLAGADPVGVGGVLPGFGDHREVELLVDAGFSPVEAIRIATLNGATFLGRDREIGSLAVGKRADLVVVKGDPASRITDLENVEIVFKDGAGYDTQKLLDSVKGDYGAL